MMTAAVYKSLVYSRLFSLQVQSFLYFTNGLTTQENIFWDIGLWIALHVALAEFSATA